LTGDSKFVGVEVDVGLRYTILPGLTWTPRFGWAFMGGTFGDAFGANNRKPQDAWTVANRLIYTF
jgi:hypothetical protein